MNTTFSPKRDAGGILHLPSPPTLHNFDPTSAIRELRRSLSRSPSKRSDQFPLGTTRSLSPATHNAPFSPSPLSPSHRSGSGNLFLVPTVPSPSPLAIPYPPSARINRPAMRRGVQSQGTPRQRTSPKSPAKRVLTDSNANANITPLQLTTRRQSDEDISFTPTGSPEEQANKENTHKVEQLAAPKTILTRLEKRHSGNFGGLGSTSSPLKRSDGIMNLDQASLGSPSAKRRSLHGASFGSDFNVFDMESGSGESQGLYENSSQDDNATQGSPSFNPGSPYFSTIPQRSSSLRKSTLQQRQFERPAFPRSRPNADLTWEYGAGTPGQTKTKNRQRMSLDNYMPPLPRDSPFSSQGALPNASVHVVGTSQQNSQQSNHVPHFPHPLSRTMTQSSSNSSITDESPTHEPVHRQDRPRPIMDFSKSMPIGASRPVEGNNLSRESSKIDSDGSFATPANYKLAKPLPAAFMSTGLISKKNRNADEPNGGLPKAQMPDTPCKRTIMPAPLVTQAFPEKAIEKARQVRHSFGTPSTPFSPHTHVGKHAASVFPKGGGIFGSHFKKPSAVRRASFVSIDGDDQLRQSQSPTTKNDSQSTTDSEFPPTPTKQTFGPGGDSARFPQHGLSPSFHSPRHSAVEHRLSSKASNSKFSRDQFSPGESVEGDSDSVTDESPSANLRLKSSLTTSTLPSSFKRSRLLRNLNSPTPLSRKALSVPTRIHSPHKGRTKSNCLSPASPLRDKFERRSPRTPQEHILPPDPSGLSISAHSERALFAGGSSSASMPPATPTAPHEYFPQFGKRTSLQLSAYDAPDVDGSLTARFETVELIGTGEFSKVYRVAQPPETSPFHSMFTLSATRSSSRSSLPERVWAVKKSKHPYAGVKDRQRKIHEVDVLKALRHSDHVISFVDSWEDNNHLYIQTEFCEEGSLDTFLAQAGLKARLDDFRIWKILLELSLGLKHVHDNGFIHLDLKPANILVTFEGVLKIADFGMATKWPATTGIEGEGDREYIGPEILMGRYDKPADVFALGLMMLETAGNVELPDNGASWQKLRNGDMSDVPSLTWSSEASNIWRDASGNPLSQGPSFEDVYGSEDDEGLIQVTSLNSHVGMSHDDRKSVHSTRSGELVQPPDFMVDPRNDQALDRIVRWMISPEPHDRPVIDQVLCTVGVHWVEVRRRAGATVFEGNWGPADEVLAEDAEMIDV